MALWETVTSDERAPYGFDLEGSEVSRLIVDYSVRLTLQRDGAPDAELSLSSPFVVRTATGESTVIPESPDTVVGVLGLLRQRIVAFAIADDGTLEVEFDGGTRLLSEPDASFEAWEMSQGPLSAVAVPGDGVSAWGQDQ